MRYRDRGLLPGVHDALRCLMATDPGTVWQLPDSEVADALAVLGRARQLLDVAEVSLVREGISRGLPAESSWSVHDWVGISEGQHAPRPAHGHVASVVRVATAGLRAGSGLSAPTAGPGADEAGAETEADTGISTPGRTGVTGVVSTFAEGELSLGKTDQLVRFHEGARRVADPQVLEADLAILLGQAKDDAVVTGPEGRVEQRVEGLDERKLAAAITMTTRMLRPDREQECLDEQQKASRSLTSQTDAMGMTRYKLILDPEGAAIIDAAVAGLSAPVPGPDGERDDRSPARRRADALVTIVGHGASSPGDAPRGDKARVVVTISLAALTDNAGRCGACGQTRPGAALGQASGSGSPFALGSTGGHAGGRTATDQVLSPSAVRKLACAGGIVPAILGTDSEPLELGRTARFFTPGQKRLLWLRDDGCTFPGCTMPAHWCDAHHLDYWSLGGCTDIDRAALLCERHHTRVHAQDLSATVTARGVTWHL